MTRVSRFGSIGLVLFAAQCGGSPEPEAKTASAAKPPAEKSKSKLPELDVMKVARALRGNETQLRECFASDSGPVRGFMRMAFEVEGSGAISNIEVETSSFAEPSVASCLTERIEGLHFEAPGEKAQTHWTFVSGLYQKSDDEADGRKRKGKKKKRADSNEQGVVIDEKSEGSLHPEEIEEIVHAGFGLFAHCYREGLARQPRLAGAVRLRMVIGRDGLVDHLHDAESDIPDPELIDCVAEGFFALRFPKPRSGTVRLLYRIVFDNG
jgi:hypothetical protein